MFRKADGTLEHVPIRDGLLARDLARFGEQWKTWQLIACIAGAASEVELHTVLVAALVGMKDVAEEVQPGHEIEGEMRAQITLPYVQAICKIAFHSVLARFHFTGFEPEFDTLKRYIYSGVGTQRALIANEPLLPQLLPATDVLSFDHDDSSPGRHAEKLIRRSLSKASMRAVALRSRLQQVVFEDGSPFDCPYRVVLLS